MFIEFIIEKLDTSLTSLFCILSIYYMIMILFAAHVVCAVFLKFKFQLKEKIK